MAHVKNPFHILSIEERIRIVSDVLHNALGCVDLHPEFCELKWEELILEIGDLNWNVEEWKWDTVLFPDSTRLTVHSAVCENMQFLEKDFTWTVDTPQGITLRQLTEGAFRMKGSEYNWWHDLFSKISCTSTVDNHLSIEAHFSHKS
uniref:Uncharacterized protein n=1 Tax=Pithovirus LCPAC304 TaxID=2506594 RepID=A0A481Z8K8_9VIRU|nr:MAG: hypothetical protein LCPAC304_05610 [Pithovirus LCPAC304]